MSTRMRSPDGSVLHHMRRAKAYSYLHYVYYQVGGARHAITMATWYAVTMATGVRTH